MNSATNKIMFVFGQQVDAFLHFSTTYDSCAVKTYKIVKFLL